jgi:SulP family sulfate permease
MQHVSNCDLSGIQMLESIVEAYRQKGGDVFMVRVRAPVLELMKVTGFYHTLGAGNFLHPDEAIQHLFYKVLDPVICIYESDVRVFRECQTLARPEVAVELPAVVIPPSEVEAVGPRQLWEELHGAGPPRVIDVREPREFQRGHIPGAELLPLPRLLAVPQYFSDGRPVVLACRSGRRSLRAAQFLRAKGCRDVRILSGGLQAWETEGLLEAVDVEGSGRTPTS